MKIQLSDITAIASLGNNKLLLILNRDVDTPSIRCCQVDLDEREYFFYDNIETPLKFTPYEEVPESEREFFRNWIARKMPNDKIVEILQWFDEEIEND